MYYFSFAIADWKNGTNHLNATQKGVYITLLTYCYEKEKPFPLDSASVYHKECFSAEEIEVAESILKEFFAKTKTGWINARCKKEIKKYKSKSETARNNAYKRWGREGAASKVCNSNAGALQAHSEGNANSELLIVNSKQLTTSPGSLDEPVQPAKKRSDKKNVIKINQPDLPGLPTSRYQLNGEEFHIDQDLYSELNKIYPFVSLTAEIPKMRAWLLANSRKRKTLGGMPRFINSWLANNTNENEAYDGGI